MRLLLMRVDRDLDLARFGARGREHVRPALGPESQEVLGDRRFLPPLEIGHGLQLVDVGPLQDECVSVPAHSIGLSLLGVRFHGGILG